MSDRPTRLDSETAALRARAERAELEVIRLRHKLAERVEYTFGLLESAQKAEAERDRLREALQEAANALEAAPPFTYAQIGEAAKASKATLNAARAALEPRA